MGKLEDFREFIEGKGTFSKYEPLTKPQHLRCGPPKKWRATLEAMFKRVTPDEIEAYENAGIRFDPETKRFYEDMLDEVQDKLWLED